jgi:hypothetical protein
MKMCPAENSNGQNKAGGRKPVMSNMKRKGKPGVGKK